MGGHALKNTSVCRVNLETLNKVKADIKQKVSTDIEIEYLNENPEKTDFGDLDILYKPDSNINIREYIKEKFNPIEIVSNADVMSFGYVLPNNEILQVDFIKCKNIQMSKFYFSYGDLGNILGNITKPFGIKFGHLGLFVNVTSKVCTELYPNIDSKIFNDFTESILLTDNPEKICEFFSMRLDLWGNFKLETDIFKWIISCKNFHPYIFVDPNYKIKHKISTRPMFNRFINWIENIPINQPIEKNCRQIEALGKFNKFKELDKLVKLHKQKYMRKEKFNGNKILELGVIQNPKDLANFIIKFKKQIENEFGSFDNWLDTNDMEQINIKLIQYKNL